MGRLFSTSAAWVPLLVGLGLLGGCPRGPDGLFERFQEARMLADEPTSVHVMDVDDDGFQDVVVGSRSEMPLAIRENLRDGRLGTELRLRLSTTEEVIGLGAVERLSRGPTLAVLLASGVALLTNPDGEGFQVPADGRVARCIDCAGFVAGDFNGDGEGDLLVVGDLISDHYPGPGLDTPQLPRPPRLLLPPRPIAVDLDRDGADDLIGTRDLGAGPEGVLLFGSSSGAFSARALPAGIQLASAIGAAEVDGDQDLDLIFVAPGLLGVILAEGGSYDRVQTALVSELLPTSLEVLDADGDGLQDLAIADESGVVRIFLGDSGGGFLRMADLSLPAPAAALHHGDLDQDGQDELLVVSPTLGDQPAVLRVYRGGDRPETGIRLDLF